MNLTYSSTSVIVYERLCNYEKLWGSNIVTGEIGFSPKINVFKRTLASRHTNPIIASGILNPLLAYIPCSRALHVKCRLLPKDLITRWIFTNNQLAFGLDYQPLL
jgi:hypothetical protein